MTSNEMPSASGVRITGDKYQWLHAWRICMEALHENLTRNTTNPIVAVGVEEAGAGNGDDVVRHRAQPPHTYTQVKYAADGRTSVNLAYLDDSRVLRKLVETHKMLTADGTSVEIELVTNRAIDPTDVLLKDRDGRDDRLMPRAAEGGAQSSRGQARTAWATAAGTDETTLMNFLEDFRVNASYDRKRLRADVGLLMTANGLRSDDASISTGVNWIDEQVIAGHRLLSLDDIKGAILHLNLQAGSPWTTVSIATIKRDHVADQALVAINWVDKISGDTDWNRIEPAPPATWDDLAAEIRTIPSLLEDHTRILVSGHMRQASGFLIGTELRRVLTYEVGVHQGDRLWTSEEPTGGQLLSTVETSVDAGPDIALIVNVSADGAPDAIEWIRESGLTVSKIVVASPTSGTGPTAIPTPGAANTLAVNIRDIARRHSRAGHIHLFLIGPLGLAVLLGHHWNRVTTTHVYEHLGGADYVHAFTVDA